MSWRAFLADRRLVVAAAGGLLLVALLHLVRLGELPSGLYLDEAAIGYNAYSLALTGADEHGVRWPLFFKSFGNYHDPVMIYCLAALVRWLPLTAGLVRAPSAVFAILAAVAFALLAWEYTRRPWLALGAGLVFSLLPWGFPLSRSVLSGYQPMLLGMAVGWWALLAALRRRSWRFAVVAGLGWALAMYAHNIGRPTTAATLLLFGLAYHWRLWRRRRTALVFALVLVAAMIPMMIATHRHGEALTARFKTLAIWADGAPPAVVAGRIAGRYAEYFGPHFLVLQGDANLRHHTGRGGMLGWSITALALLGLAQVLRRGWRRPAYRFLLLAWLAYPLAAVLTQDHYHSTRSLNGVLAWALLAVLGADWLLQRRPAPVRRWLAVALAIAVLGETGLYLRHYFGPYQLAAQPAFWTGANTAIAHAFAALPPGEVLYVDDDSLIGWPPGIRHPAHYIYFLFHGRLDPAAYQREGLPAGLIRRYQGAPDRPGLLLRSSLAYALERPGRLRVEANAKPLPGGAELLAAVPMTGVLIPPLPPGTAVAAPGTTSFVYQLYRVPGPPPP